MFENIIRKGFQVLTLHHAEAILKHDMQTAANELESVLTKIEIPIEELVRGGGGESQMTQPFLKEPLDLIALSISSICLGVGL